jgi:histidine triad (HIT) family protein
MIGRLLFWLARSRLGRRLVRWGFTRMSFAIPVKRLRETETLMAFHHPRPSHPLHILLVPKRPYASLMELSPDDTGFLKDLFATVQNLVREFDLEPGGYRLVANGGALQDVPHLHFHLIAEKEPT